MLVNKHCVFDDILAQQLSYEFLKTTSNYLTFLFYRKTSVEI